MKLKEIRLCDNPDCWNIIELLPWQLKNKKNYFCCYRCHWKWLEGRTPYRSPEVKVRISACLSGDNNPMKNPINKEKHRIAMSRPETRQKISEHCGMRRPEVAAKISGNKSISRRPERRAQQSKLMKDRNPMRDPEIALKVAQQLIGREVSLETRQKMSEAQRLLGRSGENSPCWKGGVSYAPYCPKFNKDKKEEVRRSFDYKCICCGKPESENITSTGKVRKLSVHHIFYDKQEGCNGKDFFLVPMCMTCHGATIYHQNQWEDKLVFELYACYFKVILQLD